MSLPYFKAIQKYMNSSRFRNASFEKLILSVKFSLTYKAQKVNDKLSNIAKLNN